jgi:hypothetical protein
MWIFVWLALSVLAGVIAANKGRSFFGFFLLAVVLSPLVGIIAAAVVSPNTPGMEAKQIESGESRKCPHCAELVKIDAKVCKHCGRDLPPPEGRKCPHCGNPVSAYAERCLACERSLA